MDRFSRQVILEGIGKEGQLKLKHSKVLVIGCGGLGCPSLLYLVAAGVGSITIIDSDLVTHSNLHRQVLFQESDVGKSKAKVAAKRLKEVNSDCKLTAIEQEFSHSIALELLSQHDLIVEASDNFKCKFMANDAAYQLKIPLVYASVLKQNAQVSSLCGPSMPNLRDIFSNPPITAPTCSEAGVLGATCGVVASIQALEAIKIITGMKENLSGKLLNIDLNSYRFTLLDIEHRPDLLDIKSLQPESYYNKLMIAQIKPKELEKKLEAKDDIQILDVRENKERAICSIGGKHIPLGELGDRADELDCEKETIVYCKMGGRSQQACEYLKEVKNFKNIQNLAGGILAYQEEVDSSLERY